MNRIRAVAVAAVTIGLLASANTALAVPYTAIDHRANAAPAQADENTLVGLRWDAKYRVMSEMDLVALKDNGCAAYHFKNWNQGTNGVGTPISTTTGYVKTLLTKPRGQGVPVCNEVFRALKRTGGKALLEMHYAWTDAHVQYLLNRVRAYGLQRQVWFTGTKDRLDMLASHSGPLIKTVFRVKVGKPFTAHQLDRYGVDIAQVRGNESPARVRWLRNHGYPVWGSGPVSSFPALYALGIHRVQCDTPLGWIAYANRRTR